jgi:dienelactone hydrolase
MAMPRCLWLVLVVMGTLVRQAPAGPLEEMLAREVIGPRQSLRDLLDFVRPRIVSMPTVGNLQEWEVIAGRIRREVLERIVFRGEVARWREAPLRVEWQEQIAGGPGYHIKKLRYEAVPGLWIPAVLYEPDKLSGKVPVALAVNGHDHQGKAASYKQVRCINLVRRGLIVLNVEWLGMGQLRREGLAHYRMNQLDLCGTSGLAPFYLVLSRGLDVLLSHPHADPARVTVSGLSGGGWQTIFLSALDPRVTLANPVAGYTSFRARLHEDAHDIGDSEQVPCDLGTIADYTHLTALRAPRPTLLTYNARDDCCFVAQEALPPLLEAARPIYQLYGKLDALRSHVNHDPGTHNYLKDNREAYYRMIGTFFFGGDPRYSAVEIPVDREIKTALELAVSLPADNADFNTLARSLARNLPRVAAWPASKEVALSWQEEHRRRVREVVRPQDLDVKAQRSGNTEKEGTQAVFWKLRLGGSWTVPVVELTRGAARATALLVNDAGRRHDPITAERLLREGYRVLAVDPFSFGEARLAGEDTPWILLLSAAGERPLGVQAGQLLAVARWAAQAHSREPVHLVAVGPRLGMAALVAAALDEKAIASLQWQGALASLHELIEQNRSVEQMPELFCFGLLQATDVKHLMTLVAPRPVSLIDAPPRVRAELAGLKQRYRLLGQDFDPLTQRPLSR